MVIICHFVHPAVQRFPLAKGSVCSAELPWDKSLIRQFRQILLHLKFQ